MKVVLVGAGSWGTKLANRITKPDIPFKLVGVVDESQSAAESLAHRSGCGWWGRFKLFDAVVSTGADWAIVAIPSGDARQLVCEELRAAGVTKIRVEKPLLEDPQFVDAVGHQTLFAPEAVLFAEIVRGSGCVTRWESYRCSHRPSQWGPYLDLAVHDIALRRHILGSEIVDAAHVAEYTDPRRMVERWTRVSFANGSRVVLDEQRRVVAWGKYRTEFLGAPDPLGVELRAWARGESVCLQTALDAADEALHLAGVAA